MPVELRIPAQGLLPKTSDDDPLEYYYRPLTRWLYRARLRSAVALLDAARYGAVLDVGYGSGILLPTLAARAGRVAAVDLHDRTGEVAAGLGELGIEADLRTGSLFELPYADGEFDAVLCLSVLEHVTDLQGALSELRRVTARGGAVVLGFPVRNPVTDRLFRALGYDPRAIHPSSHADILRALDRHPLLEREAERRIPPLLPRALGAYVSCRARAV